MAYATPGTQAGVTQYHDDRLPPTRKLFKVTTMQPAWDPHILGGSQLAGARNIELRSTGHFRVVADPALLAEIELAGREAPGR